MSGRSAPSLYVKYSPDASGLDDATAILARSETTSARMLTCPAEYAPSRSPFAPAPLCPLMGKCISRGEVVGLLGIANTRARHLLVNKRPSPFTQPASEAVSAVWGRGVCFYLQR